MKSWFHMKTREPLIIIAQPLSYHDDDDSSLWWNDKNLTFNQYTLINYMINYVSKVQFLDLQ